MKLAMWETFEVGYIYSLHFEEGHDWHDDLLQAKQRLRKSKGGKIKPISASTFEPLHGYDDYDIERYKSIVNEVARLKRLGKKLVGMGYYSSYWSF